MGNVTSRQITGLAPGVTYYFHVRAYNTSGQQSIPSNQVSYTVPAVPGPSLSVTSLSPTSGPTTGGTVITLQGSNFASGATVRVGGALATGVTLISSTQVRAMTPAGTTGTQSVQVTNPTGQSATAPNGFTYTSSTSPTPLAVTSVSPPSGPVSGGTAITITGTGFVSGATVRVGGVAASGVTRDSSTQLRATTPPGYVGAQNLQVTNPTGQSALAPTGFTYTSGTSPTPLTVTSVSPASGPAAGGTAVTITGTGFVSGATVRVGAAAATGVTLMSSTQLRATTPAGTAGTQSVQVTNPTGQSATSPGGFTYTSSTSPTPLAVTSVSPSSGPVSGGTAITITGTGFVSGATVRVGGVAATGVTVVSATQLRATTPAGYVGAQNLQVTNPTGQSALAPSGFTYSSSTPTTQLTVTSVSPPSGPVAGGTLVTITGTGFVSGVTVRVGGVAATGVTVVGSTQLRATTPPGYVGAQNLQVTNLTGQSALAPSGFTYTSGTSLTQQSPSAFSSAMSASSISEAADDGDGDGLPTEWETRFGLDASSAEGVNGASGDPDEDGLSNADEFRAGSHPRGLFRRYLAEGAVTDQLNTRLALANPQTDDARVLLTFGKDNGEAAHLAVDVPARARQTVDLSTIPELQGSSFSTLLESDLAVGLDRLVSWDRRELAASLVTAVDQPSTTWYFAEGIDGRSVRALLPGAESGHDASQRPGALPPARRACSGDAQLHGCGKQPGDDLGRPRRRGACLNRRRG